MSSSSTNDTDFGSDSDNSSDNRRILSQRKKKKRVLLLMAIHAANYFLSRVVKNPCRTSALTGHEWIQEILHGNENRCYEQLRMKKPVFLHLCKVLEQNYGLKPTRGMTLHEQVGLFLYKLGQPASIRNTQERLQHSGETISRQFHNVLKAIIALSRDIIKPIDPTFTEIPSQIRNDERYYPYFKDCIGAIDGTHVKLIVPAEQQVSYTCRKGYTSTNVMAVCDFSMCFTFVLAGWEGSAHDARVFMDALRTPNFHFPHPPPGKYYLVDAGYPNFTGYMGPYKTTRYHLPHFRLGRRARGRNEVFNYMHSSLRSTIERSFGCCNAKWRILDSMPQYSLKIATHVIVACMALHNFIRRNDMNDEEFLLFDENAELDDDVDTHDTITGDITWEQPSQGSTRHMEYVRDAIRDMMPRTI